MQLFYYETEKQNPYENLAAEQYILEHLPPDSLCLYLWQNRNTVVIGRNQNAWAECRTEELKADGGFLARRLSGGGAVYHDLGNLNFTFLTDEKIYDVKRQSTVILEALKSFGIRAVISGRNDIEVSGRKCSGNAFYSHNGKYYHHGTILLETDTENMMRYLQPPREKLASKSVASVRARVLNLKEICPEISAESVKKALKAAFENEYQLQADCMEPSFFDEKELSLLRTHYESWEWNYGQKREFDYTCEGHYSWGHVLLQLNLSNGCIKTVKLYCDAMDWSLGEKVEQRMKGARFDLRAMSDRLKDLPEPERTDLIDLLKKQEF